MPNNKLKNNLLFPLVFIFLFMFFVPLFVQAADEQDTWSGLFSTKACPCAPENTLEKKYVRMQLAIPGITEPPCQYKKTIYVGNKMGVQTVNCYYAEANLPDFIKKIYNFSIGIIAIMAVVIIMISGFRWILAAGNPGTIGKAQDDIKAAVSGLILILLSYTILNLVNPKLINLQLTQPTQIEKLESGGGGQCKDLADNTTIILDNKDFLIKKTATGENTPEVQSKLAELNCVTGYPIKDSTYSPDSPNNKMCYGEKCDKGVCVANEAGEYSCWDVFWAGKISWTGSNNWITEIELKYLCVDQNDGTAVKNASGEVVKNANGEDGKPIKVNTSRMKNYGIINTLQMSSLIAQPLCPGVQEGRNERARFFLKITVQRGGLQNDDDYLINKNCELIKGPNKDKPITIDWTDDKIKNLLTYKDLVLGKAGCNILIDDGTFLDR